MEVPVRELKNRLSEYLRKAKAGEEIVVTSHGEAVARLLAPRLRRRGAAAEEQAISLLRSQPWIRPGKAGKLRLPRIVLRLKPGEKTLAEIVTEQRG